ncbi:MAG: hypothetical protein R2854_22000 [Caldilineaceae bacterium]
MAGVRFVVDWVGRRPDENPGYTVTNARVKGTIRSSSAWTRRRNGIVFATSADQPGDRADGMGLPNNEQVAFVLTFRRQD